MIELVGITKTYKEDNINTIVLSEISMTVEKGEFIAIMGSSGSGKTTLLNILGCIDDASTGSYFYNGEDINTYSTGKKEKFRKEHVAYIFQQFALLNDYTVYENIELPLRARNIMRKQRRGAIEMIMKEMDLSLMANKKISNLSGGQKQRVAIARALITGNELILADEPTGSLDSLSGQEIMEILKKLNEAGKTIIMVTHDINIAAQADRIIKIVDGKNVNL